MHDLIIEKHSLNGRPLSWYLARHICSRGYQGKIAVVADKPDALLSATRKQWLKLVRQAQNECSGMVNPARADLLKQRLLWMQNTSFTSKPPDDVLEADITFAIRQELAESGDPSLKSINPDFPVFVLLGILIEKEAYRQLCIDFDAIKNKYFGSTGVILHSTDIRKCNGAFAALFELKVKQGFYNDLNHALSTAEYKIVSSVINKPNHIKKYGKLADDPYEIGLTFLLERTLFELDKGDFGADIYIESRGRREDAILASRYNQLISRGSQVSSDRFVARYGTEVTFKKKWENDCGLQLADLCAYPVARRVLFPNEPYPTFQVIESKFRRGPRGILGYGIKVFP